MFINYSLSLLSEVTGSIGVQLKYLKGLPSGTARVEVSGHQRNGQVIMTTLISCKNATLRNFKALNMLSAIVLNILCVAFHLHFALTKGV